MGGGQSKALEQDSVDLAAISAVNPTPPSSPKAAVHGPPSPSPRSHVPTATTEASLDHDGGGPRVGDAPRDTVRTAELERTSDNYSDVDGDSGGDDGSSEDDGSTTMGFAWKKGEILGSGSFGSVYLARNETTGDLMAVKEISYVDETPDDVRAIQDEVELLRSLSHPNIVAYVGSDFDHTTSTLYIFTEWVPGGSLEDNSKTFGCSEAVAQTYLAQILLGVQYLHTRQVVHYDIKPSNILIDQHGTVKLADFGASRLLGATSVAKNRSMRGTPYYMAPEVIKQEARDTKADIWSVGCTVLKMLTGTPLWKAMQFQTQVALFFHVANLTAPPPLPDSLSDDARSFVLACLQVRPEDRWTAEQLLGHPFARPPGRHLPKRSLTSASTAAGTASSYTRRQSRTAMTSHRKANMLTLDMGDDAETSAAAGGMARSCRTADSGGKELLPMADKKPRKKKPTTDERDAVARVHPVAVLPLTTRSNGIGEGVDVDDDQYGDIGRGSVLPAAHADSKADGKRRDEDAKNHELSKLPSLSPPKARKMEGASRLSQHMEKSGSSPARRAEPRIHSVVADDPIKDGTGCKSRRLSLQTAVVHDDEAAHMPKIPTTERRSLAAERPDARHVVPDAIFDETPILTDAARRERDAALEREDQKRRTKEMKERQWREEQEEYKRSLHRAE
ncbi:Aste57867_11805 [Aphanomyces stellatus]|uniref:Aste57867_11805 protein n=1 Tax=Aphanomyces stellatus TaxID=120398 RepID=A0A485KUI1_9STRA|nr:hypothetical protein As57867_011760 [Aphanomyces stellatus]VFT88660.1 Aste57867_11805 [Aphanomyces stellatus]